MESKNINQRDAYIDRRDENGNLHGYFNISLTYLLVIKGCYNHGIQYGYWERYYHNVLTTIEYYL